MNSKSRVLVTGGAGFVGSFTVDLLVERGYEVVILDCLEPQVHHGRIPGYLNKHASLIQGDLRDRKLLKKLVKDVTAVIHLASSVGIAQSMYQIEKYIDYNTKGTASLLDVLVNTENNVRKIVVASSMSIYGEGKYHCEKCGVDRYPHLRSNEQMKRKMWDMLCPNCETPLTPMPTDESKPLMPTSIYAMSKRHQEEMCLLIGKTYGIPTVALRYFNIYGPRQALKNPYTGVCAIFSSRILNRLPPYLFEDGNQRRDFIHVTDVARANLLALERGSADYQALNIGTGSPVSIIAIADLLIHTFGAKLQPYISQNFRKGDIRNCYADISKAQKLLGYESTVNLESGMQELVSWADTHKWGAVDLFNKALVELQKKGLAQT